MDPQVPTFLEAFREACSCLVFEHTRGKPLSDFMVWKFFQLQ